MIVGKGYVGSAIEDVFKKEDLVIIDPKFNQNTFKDFKNKVFDIVFVCVDTPKKENFCTLNAVLNELNNTFTGTIVCCKSTATPTYYKKAEKKYNNIKLVFCPEYLSHWNNIEDFKNQKFIIVGGDLQASLFVCDLLKSRLTSVKSIHVTDIATAALIKYAENAFLSLKVTFANELFNAHKKIKCESTFEELTALLGLDERIGHSHLQVPGRDGKYGWGGHCFIKDNYEFVKFTGSKLLQFVQKLNTIHRKKKI